MHNIKKTDQEGGTMKATLGAKNGLYPMPLTLVGATVDGDPNYSAIAHVGVMDLFTISISISKNYHTNSGIQEYNTFSVNIPSTGQVKEAEYCGLVSGRKTDKSKLFDNFYGKLKTAPMIQECPINMECQLVQTLEFPRHNVFIGEIVETYCEEYYLTNSTIDFSKVAPILFVMENTGYWRLGEQFEKAWHVKPDPSV
jgi:flavin reductase (DIM6/NTAB) family NADH-FMN oxidoreductase RutF